MKLNTLEAVCATGFGGAVSDGLHMNTIFDRYPHPARWRGPPFPAGRGIRFKSFFQPSMLWPGPNNVIEQ